MELTRKQVIEELQKMLDYCSIRQDSTPERKQALVYAISSLKTDEAYQLMYEGVKVYTEDEVIDIFEELQLEIDEKATELCDDGWWLTYNKLIQQKINAFRGKENDN